MKVNVALAGLFVKTYFKRELEYRQSFILRYVIQVISRCVELLGIWILLSKFDQIYGWSYHEVMLLFGRNLFSYGLAGLLLHGPMAELERLIQQGTFDAILVMPLNPLLHLVARHFNAVFLGHIMLSFVILGVSINALEIKWTLLSMGWFACVMLGASLVQGAILLAAGTTSFWLVKSRSLLNTAIYGVRGFITYPISIYDRWVQVVLTLLVPFAFVNFFPAEFFLGKAESSIFPAYFQLGTPLVGMILFSLAYRLWSYAINHYHSTGS